MIQEFIKTGTLSAKQNTVDNGDQSNNNTTDGP